jgi:hypothetical protein
MSNAIWHMHAPTKQLNYFAVIKVPNVVGKLQEKAVAYSEGINSFKTWMKKAFDQMLAYMKHRAVPRKYLWPKGICQAALDACKLAFGLGPF